MILQFCLCVLMLIPSISLRTSSNAHVGSTVFVHDRFRRGSSHALNASRVKHIDPRRSLSRDENEGSTVSDHDRLRRRSSHVPNASRVKQIDPRRSLRLDEGTVKEGPPQEKGEESQEGPPQETKVRKVRVRTSRGLTRSRPRRKARKLRRESRGEIRRKSRRVSIRGSSRRSTQDVLESLTWKEFNKSCIASFEPFSWTRFEPCCEGLLPCELSITGKRFFICMAKQECIDSKINARINTPDVDIYDELHTLTRFANLQDETDIQKFHGIRPKIKHLTRRPSQDTHEVNWRERDARFASPFEHICGGAAKEINKELGNDGPTQFISFSNSAKEPELAKDCTAPFDVGQRRVKVSAKSVIEKEGLVVDLSTEARAMSWCYQGACLYHERTKKHYCFHGARTAEAWPFACANRAYQLQVKRRTGFAENTWFNDPENRFEIAKSCVTWATRAREVLLLPNPKTFLADQKARFFSTALYKGMHKLSTKIFVEDDRLPATNQCSFTDNTDHCVSYDKEANTVCCCSDPACGVPCSPPSR